MYNSFIIFICIEFVLLLNPYRYITKDYCSFGFHDFGTFYTYTVINSVHHQTNFHFNINKYCGMTLINEYLPIRPSNLPSDPYILMNFPRGVIKNNNKATGNPFIIYFLAYFTHNKVIDQIWKYKQSSNSKIQTHQKIKEKVIIFRTDTNLGWNAFFIQIEPFFEYSVGVQKSTFFITPFIPWRRQYSRACPIQRSYVISHINQIISVSINVNFTYGGAMGYNMIKKCISHIAKKYSNETFNITVSLKTVDWATLVVAGPYRQRVIIYSIIADVNYSRQCLDYTCVKFNYNKHRLVTQLPDVQQYITKKLCSVGIYPTLPQLYTVSKYRNTESKYLVDIMKLCVDSIQSKYLPARPDISEIGKYVLDYYPDHIIKLHQLVKTSYITDRMNAILYITSSLQQSVAMQLICNRNINLQINKKEVLIYSNQSDFPLLMVYKGWNKIELQNIMAYDQVVMSFLSNEYIRYAPFIPWRRTIEFSVDEEYVAKHVDTITYVEVQMNYTFNGEYSHRLLQDCLVSYGNLEMNPTIEITPFANREQIILLRVIGNKKQRARIYGLIANPRHSRHCLDYTPVKFIYQLSLDNANKNNKSAGTNTTENSIFDVKKIILVIMGGLICIACLFLAIFLSSVCKQKEIVRLPKNFTLNFEQEDPWEANL